MKKLLVALLFQTIASAYALAIDYEIVETKTMGWYKSYVVKYESVSADMTTTETVSGVITIPTNGEANCIILDNHHTITDNNEAPSIQGTTSSGMLFSLAYVIAATDYIGYGATADKVHPYLCQRQNALNSIDIAKVAWDIVKNENVRLQHENLVNVGYSQGGGVAMAVHREMENNPELANELHFSGSWCGDGPYDIKTTVTDYLSHPESVSYPVGLPLLVNGFLSGAPAEMKGNLTFADFITDKMVDAGLETWLAEKNLDTDKINEKMQAVVGDRTLTVNDIFKPEMASLDGALAKKYLDFADANSICTGWHPTYPIKLIHLVCDQVVPVYNAYNAIDGLQLTEEQYLLDDSESTHADYGMTFFIKLVSELYDFNYDTTTSVICTSADSTVKHPVKMLKDGKIVIDRNGVKYDVFGRVHF